jgi:hypothetical protein
MGRILLPPYKPWDIERIAQEFLSQHWRPLQVWVDIEVIIERDLDAVIDFTSLDLPAIIGSTSRRVSDGRFVIVVQEELPDRNPNRYRFTLAQEVGHLLLHREMLEGVHTRQQAFELHRSLTAEQYSQLERDANRCAAAILMPQRLFREVAHAAYETWVRKVAQVAHVVPEDLLKRVIDDLAKSFRVSPDAARIRLQQWPLKLDRHIIESAKRRQPFISEG